MRFTRRVAAAPPEVRFLALLTLGSAAACAFSAALPVAPGRPVGLLVAAAIGSALVAALLLGAGPRITLILARHGGDEFALLLPATSADGAEHVVERLHAAKPSPRRRRCPPRPRRRRARRRP